MRLQWHGVIQSCWVCAICCPSPYHSHIGSSISVFSNCVTLHREFQFGFSMSCNSIQTSWVIDIVRLGAIILIIALGHHYLFWECSPEILTACVFPLHVQCVPVGFTVLCLCFLFLVLHASYGLCRFVTTFV